MRVLIHHDDPLPLRAILSARHPDIEVACCAAYADLPAALAAFRPEAMFGVRFAGSQGYPRRAIVESDSLRWVFVGGVGTDHVAPWDPTRLTVSNAAGVAADVMAQYVIAAILSFSMGFPRFAAQQQARQWMQRAMKPVDGRTLLVIGLGNTGAAVARLAKLLGLRVVAIRANPGPADAVDRVEAPDRLLALLPEADFVVVCLPLSPRTRGLLDETAFAAMKPGAVLIDVSRGGIVSEPALLDALRSGRIEGAALDVFETEPLPESHPLWSLENVILTPHCSSIYDGWDRKAMEMFCDGLERWKRGEPPRNVVDPRRGY